MEKDYSLLRPFDIEAAKRGEKIVTSMLGEYWEYVAGPDAEGNLYLRVKNSGCFTQPSASPASFFRMAPLAWVRVSADDPTMRPVYKGDVLWLEKAGCCITVDGTARNSSQQDCLFSGFNTPHDEMWWPIELLTWTPPKVKREGWVNVYKSRVHCFKYETKEFADNSARFGDGTIDPDRIACIRIEWEE